MAVAVAVVMATTSAVHCCCSCHANQTTMKSYTAYLTSIVVDIYSGYVHGALCSVLYDVAMYRIGHSIILIVNVLLLVNSSTGKKWHSNSDDPEFGIVQQIHGEVCSHSH